MLAAAREQPVHAGDDETEVARDRQRVIEVRGRPNHLNLAVRRVGLLVEAEVVLVASGWLVTTLAGWLPVPNHANPTTAIAIPATAISILCDIRDCLLE